MGTCTVCNKKFKDEYFDVEQNKCIFHSDKNENNGWYTFDANNKKEWTSEKVKLFWEKIRSFICESQQGNLKFFPISFKNIIFPKFEGNGLANMEYYEDSFFMKNQTKEFTQTVEFNHCTFLDYVNLTYIQFEKDIVFSECILKDEIKFKQQQKIRISFLKCPEIRSLNVSRTVFEQKVEIKECVVNSCNFENARFKKVCDFYKTEFHCNNFTKTTFEDIAVFTKSEFHKGVNFKYTTFEKLVLFRKTIFEKQLNLEDSIIKEEANFLEITSKKDEIKDIDVANRETARIIKNSFEQQNNIIEANKFYALEMKKREEELEKEIKDKEKRNLKSFTDYFIFKVHGITSNHSQDPISPIIWIFSISFFYLTLTQINLQDFSFGNRIYYHVVNFVGIFITLLLYYKRCEISHTCKILYVGILQLSYLKFISDCNYMSIFDTIADKINPFSIMTGKEHIFFGLLLFKITIAYLIYQFIVSVRQNTRRK